MDKRVVNLVLTVGLPLSGKSTWAAQTGVPVVNRDSIRLAIHGPIQFIKKIEDFVSQMEEWIVEALILSGSGNIIIDATHLRLSYWNRWAAFAADMEEQHGFTIVIRYKKFFVSEVELYRRARVSEREHLIPVIGRMAKYIEEHPNEAADVTSTMVECPYCGYECVPANVHELHSCSRVPVDIDDVISRLPIYLTEDWMPHKERKDG
jgi:predicted kinase